MANCRKHPFRAGIVLVKSLTALLLVFPETMTAIDLAIEQVDAILARLKTTSKPSTNARAAGGASSSQVSHALWVSGRFNSSGVFTLIYGHIKPSDVDWGYSLTHWASRLYCVQAPAQSISKEDADLFGKAKIGVGKIISVEDHPTGKRGTSETGRPRRCHKK